MSPDIEKLAAEALAGSRRAVSKCISLVEGGGAGAASVLRALEEAGRDAGAGSKKNALLIGVTGPPGSGKSTLVNRLADSYARAGKRVGVIAVDPSSPFSGGAILGDRVRMDFVPETNEIFFRSMGSRGAWGGLSDACAGAARVLDACGYDPILLETVGVGQSEVEIVRHADVVVVVMVPGLGDEIQSIKAGILEIGDVYAVNKSDLPGADRTAHELRAVLAAPVLMVSAATGDGIDELIQSVSLLAQTAGQKKRLPGSVTDILSSAAFGRPAAGQKERSKDRPFEFKEGPFKMNALKIDHIGVAVKSLEEGLAFYENTLGIKSQGVEEVAEQKVKVAFLPCGDSELELLESTDPEGAVARFIEKNGEGIQHIAIRVENIEAALAELKEKGVRLIDEEPRYGAGGARIAFVHPKATNGVLLELCQRD